MQTVGETQMRSRASQKRPPIDLDEDLRNDGRRLIAIGKQLVQGGQAVVVSGCVGKIGRIHQRLIGTAIGHALESVLGPILKDRMREEGVTTMDDLARKILSRVPPEFALS
jgi:hypothetical protein